MTAEELTGRYMVPPEIIREYDSLLPDGEAGQRCYDAADLKQMGLLMSLRDVGFGAEEAREYMRLNLEQCKGCAEKLYGMLEKKRRETLEDIHCKEENISRLDFLMLELAHSSSKEAV